MKNRILVLTITLVIMSLVLMLGAFAAEPCIGITDVDGNLTNDTDLGQSDTFSLYLKFPNGLYTFDQWGTYEFPAPFDISVTLEYDTTNITYTGCTVLDGNSLSNEADYCGYLDANGLDAFGGVVAGGDGISFSWSDVGMAYQNKASAPLVLMKLDFSVSSTAAGGDYEMQLSGGNFYGTYTAAVVAGCTHKNSSGEYYTRTQVGDTVPVTCTEDGYTEWKCSNCNENYKVYVTKLGHPTKEWRVKTPAATCLAFDLEGEYCTTCNTWTGETRNGDRLSHDYKDYNTATCTVAGESWRQCSRCNDVLNRTTAEPLGHDWDCVVNSSTGMYDCTCRREGCGETMSIYDTVYVKNGGNGTGSSADSPCGSLVTAYELLAPLPASVEGHIILLGNTDVPNHKPSTVTNSYRVFAEPEHACKITIESSDATNKAHLIFGASPNAVHWYFSGETELKNVVIDSGTYATGLIFAARGNFVTFGTGIEMYGTGAVPTAGTVQVISGNPTKVYVLGGYNTGDTTATTTQHNHLAIYSGEYWAVFGYNRSITSTVTGTAEMDFYGSESVFIAAGSTGNQSNISGATTTITFDGNVENTFNFITCNQNTTATDFRVNVLFKSGNPTFYRTQLTLGQYTSVGMYYDARDEGATDSFNTAVDQMIIDGGGSVAATGTFVDYCTTARAGGHTLDSRRKCTFCGYVENCPHTNKTLVVDTAPTCSEVGTGHNVCDLCLETTESNVSIPIENSNHGGTYTWQSAGEFYDLVCGDCGRDIITNATAAEISRVYISDDGDSLSEEQNGLSEDKPINSLKKAYKMLAGTPTQSGEIIVVGSYTVYGEIDADGSCVFTGTEHSGKITVKGASEDSQLIFDEDRNIYCLSGDTEFCDLDIHRTSAGTVDFVARGHHLTMGEGLGSMSNDEDFVSLIGGWSSSDDPTFLNGAEINLTVKSGNYLKIVGLCIGDGDSGTYNGSIAIEIGGDDAPTTLQTILGSKASANTVTVTQTATLTVDGVCYLGEIIMGNIEAPGVRSSFEKALLVLKDGEFGFNHDSAIYKNAETVEVYFNVLSDDIVAGLFGDSRLYEAGIAANIILDMYDSLSYYCEFVRGGHTFENNYCTYCGAAQSCAHSSADNKKILVKKPTCATEGLEFYTCGKCGRIKGLYSLPTSTDIHEGNFTWTAAQNGTYNYVCEKCGNALVTGYSAERMGTVYVKNDGVDYVPGDMSKMGLTAGTAINSLADAMRILAENPTGGGTVYVIGTLIFEDTYRDGESRYYIFEEPAHTGKIKITSAPGEVGILKVDVEKAAAKTTFHYFASGETELCDIHFDYGSFTVLSIIAARHNHLIMGENLVFEGRKPQIALLGGCLGGEFQIEHGEDISTHLTIKGGTYNRIAGGAFSVNSSPVTGCEVTTCKYTEEENYGTYRIDISGNVTCWNYFCMGGINSKAKAPDTLLTIDGNLIVKGKIFFSGYASDVNNTTVVLKSGTISSAANIGKDNSGKMRVLGELKVYYLKSSPAAAFMASRIDAIPKPVGTLGRYTGAVGVDELCPETELAHRKSTPVETVAATCNSVGYRVYRCADCGNTFKDDYVLTLPAHTFDGGWQVEREPTCTEAGINVSYCSVCREQIFEVTDPLEHDFVYTGRTILPTTYSRGYDVYECSKCGTTEQRNFVPPLGDDDEGGCDVHSFVLRGTASDGCSRTYTYRCEVCGVQKQTTMTSHDFTSWESMTLTEGTSEVMTRKCSKCGKVEVVVKTVDPSKSGIVYNELGEVNSGVTLTDITASIPVTALNDLGVDINNFAYGYVLAKAYTTSGTLDENGKMVYNIPIPDGIEEGTTIKVLVREGNGPLEEVEYVLQSNFIVITR